MNYDGGLSASDVALLTNNRNGNDEGFGNGSGAWWIIIFLIFAFLGWGNRGYANTGGNSGGGGVMDGYVLTSDFATVERKLDTIQAGIYDSTFALNNTIVNGNNAIQSTLCQGFAGVNQNLVTQGYETRIGINGLMAQISDCCCQLKEGIAGVNYNIAMNTNNIQNAMCMNTRDILESQSSNTHAILDAITANKIENKNAQILAQQNEINALRLAASQERQNAYLLNELKPYPSAAYIVPNPNCCYQYQVAPTNTAGCNCGNY